MFIEVTDEYDKLRSIRISAIKEFYSYEAKSVYNILVRCRILLAKNIERQVQESYEEIKELISNAKLSEQKRWEKEVGMPSPDDGPEIENYEDRRGV